MNNQINISNLTPEQIQDLKKQIEAFEQQPKSITDKIRNWTDASNRINPRYWINTVGHIQKGEASTPTKNHVPSEKHAKSLLATSQLIVIAEALNEGWKPDWNDEFATKYKIRIDKMNKLMFEINYLVKETVIYFKSQELAEYAMTQFADLWYDYFMIDKPNK